MLSQALAGGRGSAASVEDPRRALEQVDAVPGHQPPAASVECPSAYRPRTNFWLRLTISSATSAARRDRRRRSPPAAGGATRRSAAGRRSGGSRPRRRAPCPVAAARGCRPSPAAGTGCPQPRRARDGSRRPRRGTRRGSRSRLHALRRAAKRLDLLRRRPFGRERRELDLDHASRLGQLFHLLAEQRNAGARWACRLQRRGDIGPAARPGLDQPVRDQHADRLSHRADADRVRRGQIAVPRQLGARRKLAADDLGAKAIRDRGGEVGAPDGRPQRHVRSTVPNTEAPNVAPSQRVSQRHVDKSPAS